MRAYVTFLIAYYKNDLCVVCFSEIARFYLYIFLTKYNYNWLKKKPEENVCSYNKGACKSELTNGSSDLTFRRFNLVLSSRYCSEIYKEYKVTVIKQSAHNKTVFI